MYLLPQQFNPIFIITWVFLHGKWKLKNIINGYFCNFFKIWSKLSNRFCSFYNLVAESMETPNILNFFPNFHKKAPANILLALSICMDLIVKMKSINHENCLFLDNFYGIKIDWQKRVIVSRLFWSIFMHFLGLLKVCLCKQLLSLFIECFPFKKH